MSGWPAHSADIDEGGFSTELRFSTDLNRRARGRVATCPCESHGPGMMEDAMEAPSAAALSSRSPPTSIHSPFAVGGLRSSAARTPGLAFVRPAASIAMRFAVMMMN